MNHVVRMKIDQSLQSTMGYGSYFHFLEGFLVNWDKTERYQWRIGNSDYITCVTDSLVFQNYSFVCDLFKVTF